jgi:hypothetical protein
LLSRNEVRQDQNVLKPELWLDIATDELAAFGQASARNTSSTMADDSTTSKAASRRTRSMTRPGGPSGRTAALT